MCSIDSTAAGFESDASSSQFAGRHELISSVRPQIYCRPTYEFVEVRFMDIKQSAMSRRNVIVRFILTLIYIVIITTLCCMLPFFADFVALCGAIGFTPLVCLINLGLHPAFCPPVYPQAIKLVEQSSLRAKSCYAACTCV